MLKLQGYLNFVIENSIITQCRASLRKFLKISKTILVRVSVLVEIYIPKELRNLFITYTKHFIDLYMY